MSDRDTFASVTTRFLLDDMDRWLVEKIAEVSTDRGAKPPDVYHDRGRLSALREVRTLVLATKNNEPSI